MFYKLGLGSHFFGITLVFYLLIVLSFIDFKYKAVPDYLLVLIFIAALFAVDTNFISAFTNGLIFAGSLRISGHAPHDV